VIHDIDNEGYHVPRGHPSLYQLYGNDYADAIVEGIPISYGKINDKPAKLWSVRQYQKLLPKFDHLPEENQRMWLYTTVFPSTVIGLYPDAIEIYMTIPNSAGTTDFIGASYALPDDRRETKIARYLTKRINMATDAEDESFVSWIQEGFKSSVFPEPKLSSLENGVRHLHKQIQAKIPVGNLKDQPNLGQVQAINQQMLHKSNESAEK
jgi:phenylpropionate dioxygenase-like ring-hydroxylating dioxygenase large terminal subunit